MLTHCFAGTLFCCFTDTLFCGCQYGWKHGVAMPGGRSEVFREQWMRSGTPVRRAGLVEEQAAPRSVALRGENIEAVAAGQKRPRWSGIRCRDGAGADGIRVRTASSPRGLGPEGILDADTLARGIRISGPHRRARKIGVQTAPAARFVPVRCSAVSLRPEPVPSARGWCIGCDPGEIPPATPQSRPIVCIRKMLEYPFGRDPVRRVLGYETDANHCHTDANHCHILPSPVQSALKTLSSSPEP